MSDVPQAQPQAQPTHPRDAAIERAVQEMFPWVAEWRERHGLTAIETMYVMNVWINRICGALCLAEREGITQQPKAGG